MKSSGLSWRPIHASVHSKQGRLETKLMNREQLTELSAQYIRQRLQKRLPQGAAVYLFGSRARGDQRWNSDFDLWIDADIPDRRVTEIIEEIDESFVPFKVDIVTTPKLRGRFGDEIRKEAKRWM